MNNFKPKWASNKITAVYTPATMCGNENSVDASEITFQGLPLKAFQRVIPSNPGGDGLFPQSDGMKGVVCDTRCFGFSFQWSHFLTSCSGKPMETPERALFHEVYSKVQCSHEEKCSVLQTLLCK